MEDYLQLESDSLESLGRRLHHFLSGECGASERDLVWSRMGCEPWAEVVVTAENLEDTRREELLT